MVERSILRYLFSFSLKIPVGAGRWWIPIEPWASGGWSLQWWYTSLNSFKGHPRGGGIRGWMHNFWGVFLWNLFFGSWTSSTCAYDEHCAISFVVSFVCKWHLSITHVFLLIVVPLSINGGFCSPSSWRTWFSPKELLRRKYSSVLG